MKKREWKPITELRKTEYNCSGWSYPYEYAKARKNMSDAHGYAGNLHGPYSVAIREQIEVRQNASGDIEYRPCEMTMHHFPEKYHTRFGTFISDNQGEFGGKLILPDGHAIGGNYEAAFDCGDKVYVIGSHAHMLIAGVCVMCFTAADQYTSVYSAGDWDWGDPDLPAYSREKDADVENMCMAAYSVVDSTLYLLTDGDIVNKAKREFRRCSRLIVIEDGKVKKELEFSEGLCLVKNMIVKDGTVYVAMDKLLMTIALDSGEYEKYTFLSEEDEENIRKAMEKQMEL